MLSGGVVVVDVEAVVVEVGGGVVDVVVDVVVEVVEEVGDTVSEVVVLGGIVETTEGTEVSVPPSAGEQAATIKKVATPRTSERGMQPPGRHTIRHWRRRYRAFRPVCHPQRSS